MRIVTSNLKRIFYKMYLFVASLVIPLYLSFWSVTLSSA